MNELLIQGADILRCDSDRCRVLRGHDIHVVGNLITAVEPAGAIVAAAGIEVIPAAGLLAMPGLINTHAHVSMGIFRGLAEDVDIATWFNEYIWPLEANLTAEDVFWGMQLGLAEMIAARGDLGRGSLLPHGPRRGGGGAGGHPGGPRLGGLRQPG